MSAFSVVDALALSSFALACALFAARSPRWRLARQIASAATAGATLLLGAGLAFFYRPSSWANLLAALAPGDFRLSLEILLAPAMGAFAGAKWRGWRARRLGPAWRRTTPSCAPASPARAGVEPAIGSTRLPNSRALLPFFRWARRPRLAATRTACDPTPPTPPGPAPRQALASRFELWRSNAIEKVWRSAKGRWRMKRASIALADDAGHRRPTEKPTGASDAPKRSASPPGVSPAGRPWGLTLALALAGLAPLLSAGAASAQPHASPPAGGAPAASDPAAMRKTMLRGLLQSSQIVFQKEGDALVPRCRCGPRLEPGQVPKRVADALVATEDKRFFDHYGVDPIGAARGMLRSLTRRRAEGGSTLTQQLVKNAILTPDRTLARKTQEAQLAFAVEAAMSKQEIMAAYLNHAAFGGADGREIIGARQAALYFFGREIGELTLGEAAGLVGMLKAPSSYSPARHPDAFEARRRVVLDLLEGSGRVSQSEIAQARRPLRPHGPKRPDWAETRWFVEIAMAELKRRLPDFVPSPGARVAVSFVYDRQNALETGVAQGLRRLARALPVDGLQTAAVALGPDGRLLAVMGGRDYGVSPFNRALLMARQAASTYKVFVYAAALDAGAKAGPTMTRAFATSDNDAAVEWARATGVDKIERMARRHGIASPVTIRDPNNVALGANAVGAIELTGAMLPYVNAGRAVRPYATFGVWKDGEPAFWKEPKAPAPALTPRVVAAMRPMLRAVVAQGTAAGHVRPTLQAAGKTGTSDDNRDGWFIGFTPRHVVGVWLGRDDNQPVPGLTGGATAEVFDAAAAALAAQAEVK